MKRLLVLIITLMLIPVAMHAANAAARDTIVVYDTIYITQWLPLPPATVVVDSAETPLIKKVKQHKARKPARVHFAWGAELAGHVDMTANDMSAMGFSAYFGMRCAWLQMLGVGASANVMISNSCRSFPLFGIIRTDMPWTGGRLFLEGRGGMAVNYLENDSRQIKPYASGAIGVKLASGRHFASHLSVGYSYFNRHDYTDGVTTVEAPSLHLATIRLGISF